MDHVTILTDRFDRALLYATHVHGGQVRKGTSTPYVARLLAVSATVLEYGGDEDLAIAALLHDSVEDQGGKARLADVRNRFGDRVASVVEACSDSLADPAKGERKADWQKRKETYLAHLGTADEDVPRNVRFSPTADIPVQRSATPLRATSCYAASQHESDVIGCLVAERKERQRFAHRLLGFVATASSG